MLRPPKPHLKRSVKLAIFDSCPSLRYGVKSKLEPSQNRRARAEPRARPIPSDNWWEWRYGLFIFLWGLLQTKSLDKAHCHWDIWGKNGFTFLVFDGRSVDKLPWDRFSPKCLTVRGRRYYVYCSYLTDNKHLCPLKINGKFKISPSIAGEHWTSPLKTFP